ncbi:MAG: ATP-binding cassette domain-containing protein [Candidatus Peribacteraceae bacterium]|nr:ATP-binding cassette domain-containing protein [Candidatus Peribacteraceae bacterium]
MIVLKNVTKIFGRTHVLRDVSLRIEPKEFVCIVGPSGAGKSTLIHLLIGAEDVTSGEVEVDGVNLRAIPAPVMQLYRRRIGVVFQDYKLLPNRTVAENIAFPLEVSGMSDADIAARVGEVLAQMGLSERASAFPSALSGGEKARTAIARAIVHRPLIVLADEPTGNLDPGQSLQILQLFQQLHASGQTVLLATHDSAMVDTLQTRVVRLENGMIARDSAGGYHAAPLSDAEPKHEILAGAEEELEKSARRAAGKRKIRITSIRS